MSKTALIKQIRRSDQYEQWKRAVFIRDRFTCQQCGARNGRKQVIEAHHIIELSALVQENNLTTVEMALECAVVWDVNNGQTLCRSCHEKTDSYPKRLKKNSPVKQRTKRIRD